MVVCICWFCRPGRAKKYHKGYSANLYILERIKRHIWFAVTSLSGGPDQSTRTYSELDGQHDFSESPNPFRACGEKGSGYARL